MLTCIIRIGIVFVFQNSLIRLFTWRVPTHTLSFLSVYTFVCLDPYLLVMLPLATVLLFIMVPAFLTRHPPPPLAASTSSTTSYYSYSGPPLAPPRTIKPASETSKDFFRNMRDLQNTMSDFATMHDTTISLVAPPTNFSDEMLSSALFLYLTVITAVLSIAAPIVPWRFILLLAGYAAIVSGHPTIQTWLSGMQRRAKEKSEAAGQEHKRSSTGNLNTLQLEIPILNITISIPTSPLAWKSALSSFSAITLDTAPETREVEIFELQHRPHSLAYSAGEWHPHLFTPTPYDPLSPARISGDRPHGTRFFEDVQAPRGWTWAGKKWELDLEAREWVAERLVTGVEFADVEGSSAAMDTDGGEIEQYGGWVWDLPPKGGSGGSNEEMWLAYGVTYDAGSKKTRKNDYKKEVQAGRDWEEGSWAGDKTGEWRRRRWVRLVKRIGVNGLGGDEKARQASRTFSVGRDR